MDWTNSTLSYTHKKTGVPVIIHLGVDTLNLLKDLPAEGQLFTYLSSVRTGNRATEFEQEQRHTHPHNPLEARQLRAQLAGSVLLRGARVQSPRGCRRVLQKGSRVRI